MAMNGKLPDFDLPVWFDGKSINEALFCEEYLQTHKIIYANGAFFTPEGRVTDELPLRSEIFEILKSCAVSNIPRKISNIWNIPINSKMPRAGEHGDFLVSNYWFILIQGEYGAIRNVRTYRRNGSNDFWYVCT